MSAWLWLAAALPVGFVSAEIAARAWMRARARAYAWTPGARARLEVDRAAAPELEPVIEHRFNRDGERGAEPPAAGEPAFRVLVVGGSAAECYFLDQDSAWPAVLERELSRPESLAALHAERVHVGNAARSLVTCRHLDTLVERHLAGRERLDAIVILAGASDVVSWLEHDAPAVIDEAPIPPQRLFGWHPDGPFGWKPSKLALRRAAVLVRSLVLHPLDRRSNVGRRLAEQRRMRAEATTIVRELPDPTPLVRHFDLWFERLVRRCQRHARLVVVARQPWLERDLTPAEERRLWSFAAGRPHEGVVTKYFAREVAWRLLGLVDERARSIARDLGVASLDLNAHVAPTFENYYDDLHHTPAGCRKIGAAVAQAVIGAANERRTVQRRALDAPSVVELSRAKELREAS